MPKLLKALYRTPETIQAKGETNPIVLDQKHLAAFVGLIATLMPLVLFLGGQIESFCSQSSISHSYYMPFMGAVFVAMLGFIGLFMLAYKGHTTSDWWLAKIGGLAALIVAIFPTAHDGCHETAYIGQAFVIRSETTDIATYQFDFAIGPWSVTSQMLHAGGATVLFVILGWFALWSFRRNNGEGVVPSRHQPDAMVKTNQKTRRNIAYTLCGLIIFGCLGKLLYMVWTKTTYADGFDGWIAPFFVYEAVALFAFGISWMIKGRMIPWFNDAQSGLRYARSLRQDM